MYNVLYVPSVFSTFEAAYEVLGNLLKYAIALTLEHLDSGSKPHTHLLSSLERFSTVLQGSSPSRYDAQKGKY